MTLSPWFCIEDDGRPIHKGKYEWEIFLPNGSGIFCRIQVTSAYDPALDAIVINGRVIQIVKADCWRGFVK